MTSTPLCNPDEPGFPGDPSPQPPFGLRDSLRSAGLWALGASHLGAWSLAVRGAARLADLRRVDFLLKLMSRAIPALAGVAISTRGAEVIDTSRAYVYVSNHVNVFDMFALYQAIPQYTRALEHIDHFAWPLIGPILTAAHQIPVDPGDRRRTAAGLRTAAAMLARGESVTVLPEGSRTLDGSVGPFYPGAFRLAIQAGAPVIPMAIRGGRAISRRGDWRIRPGREEVLFAAPVPTLGLRAQDAPDLAARCREIIIDLLQGRRLPGK